MLSYVFLLALLAPALVSVQATAGIQQCTNDRPLPRDIEIVGCAETPCDVFQGSDAVMNVTFFAPPSGATILRPQVFATALGVTIEYPLPPPFQNGCDNLSSGSCPLAENSEASWRFAFPITSTYPPIPVTIQLTLYNQFNELIFCAVVDIHVRIR